MIPIRDDNPTHHRPYVTIALIAINVLVFLVEYFQPGPKGMERFIYKYGYVPAELRHRGESFRQQLISEGSREEPVLDRRGRPVVNPRGQFLVRRVPPPVEEASALPPWVNIFSCMFLHGGWMHLLGNMLYLWIFGNNVEDRLGPVLFVFFYLMTGVVGNLAHTFFEPGVIPLVGASGAISGVMGGYVLLFPKARVLAILPMYFYFFTVTLPAWMFLGVYYLVQNLVPAFRGSADSVAYWAHIGGFAAGAAAIYLFPHRARPRMARPVPARVRSAFDDADIEL